MNISIFGLGYVGVVCCAILSQKHKVIGVDINKTKVDIINEGRSPIIEKDVDDLMKKGVESGNLEATDDAEHAVLNSEMSIVCVGTPSNEDGSHNLEYIHNVMKQITDVIKKKGKYHLIVLRSTSPLGTTEDIKEKYLDGIDAGICFNPEFLREGSAVKDYMEPPFIVVSCSDEKGKEMMKELYSGIDAEFVEATFKEAEIIKVWCNVFHALKIVFANEVKRFSDSHKLDAKRIMEILCKDKKLNISSTYLRPGFAYGGSCLPKDLRSLQFMAEKNKINLPVIDNIDNSNEEHINDTIRQIEGLKPDKIGFIGLSFKEGTDDLRESPSVKVVEHFIKNKADVKIFDREVSMAKLMGANKSYIENEIPHISSLIVEKIEDMEDRDIIVLNKKTDYDFSKKKIVDLR